MEIINKMRNYSAGEDYEPLQVELEVIPPVYLTSPFLHFDGIISYLCMRDCLDDDFYILPSNLILPVDELALPLKKTDDVYHSSVGLFDKAILKKNTIYKRFTDKETFHLTKKQQKGRIKTNQGHFKDFMIDLPLLLTNKVTFYCNGDKKELKRLLKHLKAIGKKTDIGGGRIKKTNITGTPEDYSFFKDNKIMRPIPTNMKIPIFEGMKIQRQPYKPPYWNKENMVMCFVPETNIKV